MNMGELLTDLTDKAQTTKQKRFKSSNKEMARQSKKTQLTTKNYIQLRIYMHNKIVQQKTTTAKQQWTK